MAMFYLIRHGKADYTLYFLSIFNYKILFFSSQLKNFG